MAPFRFRNPAQALALTPALIESRFGRLPLCSAPVVVSTVVVLVAVRVAGWPAGRVVAWGLVGDWVLARVWVRVVG